MNVAKGLLVSVLCLSSGLLAAQNHHSQWKKVYERNLTDFELSPEGSGLVLLAQPQGRCRMDVDFYGETGRQVRIGNTAIPLHRCRKSPKIK